MASKTSPSQIGADVCAPRRNDVRLSASKGAEIHASPNPRVFAGEGESDAQEVREERSGSYAAGSASVQKGSYFLQFQTTRSTSLAS